MQLDTSLERPADVREACQLALGAWLISTAALLIVTYHQPFERSVDRYGMIGLFGLAMIVFAIPRFFFLRKIWRGRTWARIALLIVFGIGWTPFVQFIWVNPLAGLDPLRTIAGAAAIALEVFAAILLFSRRSTTWFNHNSHSEAAHGVA